MEGKPYDHKSDIYSLAIVMWELLEQRVPFDKQDSFFRSALEIEIIKGLRPDISRTEEKVYNFLIQTGWHADPNERPSAAQFVVTLTTLLQTVK